MRRITHYLLELDSTEKNYIEDLVDGLCSDQAQLSRLLIDNEEKICTPCCTAIVELVLFPACSVFGWVRSECVSLLVHMGSFCWWARFGVSFAIRRWHSITIKRSPAR